MQHILQAEKRLKKFQEISVRSQREVLHCETMPLDNYSLLVLMQLQLLPSAANLTTGNRHFCNAL